MMQRFINHVRKKPTEQKRWYVYGITGILSLFVVGIWMLSMQTPDFSQVSEQVTSFEEELSNPDPNKEVITTRETELSETQNVSDDEEQSLEDLIEAIDGNTINQDARR